MLPVDVSIHGMTLRSPQSRELPAQQWDSIPQFARRLGISTRTVARKIEGGMRGVIRITTEPGKRGVIRIDPLMAMADLRDELPARVPEPPRRGRQRKRATASPTA